ncbi:MAG: MFS transporter, partial [Actinomycetes bacterium]
MSGGATKTAVPRLAVIGLATSMLGMAALPFAVTGTNLAIPLIKKDFGSSLAALSWTLSGYSIIIAALTMLGGVISVRIGTLRAFQIGIGIFVAASAVCAFAPNIAVLIGGRIFQGMGGALVVPASIS